jgi:hypothetical protein
MQLTPFLEQLLFAFLVIRVRYAGVYRADLSTPWRLKVTDTFGTAFGIYDVDGFSLRDGVIHTFSFAGSATYTVISDFVSHFLLPSVFIRQIFFCCHTIQSASKRDAVLKTEQFLYLLGVLEKNDGRYGDNVVLR